jgi:hypothetical protein
VIAFGYGVTALHWGGPISTRLNTYNGLGWTPKPTALVSQASLGIIKLLRRQETRVNVCGYIGGDLGTVNALKTIQPNEWDGITNVDAKTANTFTCFTSTETCVFANNGGLGCCDVETDTKGSSSYPACGFYTSCLNRQDLSLCFGDCLTGRYVRKW